MLRKTPRFELGRDPNVIYNVAGMVTGDFNNDGKLDLIQEVGGQPIGFYLQIGNGDGAFQAPKEVSSIPGYGFDLTSNRKQPRQNGSVRVTHYHSQWRVLAITFTAH